MITQTLKTVVSKVMTIKNSIQISAITLLALISLPIHAQTVEPMIMDLEPLGKYSSESIRIENTTNKSMTMEISAFRLEVDQQGNETLTPADDDFLIYPPQTIIDSDSAQVVKVKYIGDPTIQSSQAYRISVNQLPVNLQSSGTSGINILSRFLTLLNVSPKDSQAKISVLEVASKDESTWRLMVENTGSRYGRLSLTEWNISDKGDNKTVLNAEQISDMASKRLVLPNSKLELEIPALKGFDPSTTQIEIKEVI